MGRAFGILWQSIKDFYDDLFPFVGMNLVWLVLSIVPFAILWFALAPVVPPYLYSALATGAAGEDAASLEGFVAGLYPVLVVLLLMLLPNPAGLGVQYFANQKINDERVEFGLSWQGFRKYWKPAMLLFLISLAGTALLLANIVFYLTRDSDLLRAAAMFFIFVLLIIWLPMQLYLLPLLMEQESKSLRLVLRNAAVITLASPGVSITTFLLILVFAILSSIVLPILASLITGSLVAIIEQRTVVTLLEKYRSASRR